MSSGWFQRFRERQEAKALEKARSEGFAEGRHHAEVLRRVECTLALLAIAELRNDPVLLQRACSEFLPVLTELNEMNRNGIAGGGRLVEHIEKLRKAN